MTPKSLLLALALALSLALIACARPLRRAQREATAVDAPTVAVDVPKVHEPVRMEELATAGDLPVWAGRGGDPERAEKTRVVFVPGMCVHPLGYAQSFQHAAMARGSLVTLQADLSCGGDGSARRWSSDLGAMSKRIDAAVRTAELDVEAKGVTLVGYSQGAERAEWLASRFPEKYTRLVLIASPIVPSPERLGRAKAVALLAGSRDWYGKRNMLEGEQRLRRAGIAVQYFDLPNAQHGEMGDDPEGVMSQALDFVDKSAPLKEISRTSVTR